MNILNEYFAKKIWKELKFCTFHRYPTQNCQGNIAFLVVERTIEGKPYPRHIILL